MMFRFHVVIIVLRKSVVHVRILMRKEGNVSDSFSLVVIFMINCAVVLPSSRFRLANFGNKGTESIINELRFHILVDIEITNWVDRLESRLSLSS